MPLPLRLPPRLLPKPALQTSATVIGTPGKPAIPFTLAPVPLRPVDKSRPACDEHDLAQFTHLMIELFGKDPVWVYQIAEKLDLHRAVVDEWLFHCVHSGRARYDTPWTIRFPKTSMSFDKTIKVNLKSAREYDPWDDRSYDNLVRSTGRVPYYVIDRYYTVQADEVLLATGTPRTIDGKTFLARPFFKSQVTRETAKATDPDWYLVAAPVVAGQWDWDAYLRFCETCKVAPKVRTPGLQRRVSGDLEAHAVAEQAALDARVERLGLEDPDLLAFFYRAQNLSDDYWIKQVAKAKDLAARKAVLDRQARHMLGSRSAAGRVKAPRRPA